MTSKEYLRQIREIYDEIESLKKEREAIEIDMASPKGISYDKDVIQSSPSADGMVDVMIKLEEIGERIGVKTVELWEKREKIVNQIYAMHDYRYSSVLYERYVENKSFELISVEMGYNYDHTRALHREALDKFAEIYGFYNFPR